MRLSIYLSDVLLSALRSFMSYHAEYHAIKLRDKQYSSRSACPTKLCWARRSSFAQPTFA